MVKYPVVVHVDIDFAFFQPMDELFDAIIYDANSPEGQAARAKIPLEFPEEVTLPEKIDAFYTRDWPQVYHAGIFWKNTCFRTHVKIVRGTVLFEVFLEKYTQFFGQSYTLQSTLIHTKREK